MTFMAGRADNTGAAAWEGDSSASQGFALAMDNVNPLLLKCDTRPQLCLIRQRTAAGNLWIAKRLAMGHSGSVSRLVTAAAKHPPTVRELKKLDKMLKCET